MSQQLHCGTYYGGGGYRVYVIRHASDDIFGFDQIFRCNRANGETFLSKLVVVNKMIK